MITRTPLIVVTCLCLFCGCRSALAEPAKSDFRGLKTGMSRQQAEQAAAANGGRCEDLGVTTVAGQTVCAFGTESRAILSFSPKMHVTRIHIIFSGDFDDIEMQKYIIETYKLSIDPLSPSLFTNGTADHFIFSRMGSNNYSLDITNHDVALKDGARRKSALPKL